MSRYFLIVQYDGLDLHGSQIQKGQPTVQQFLNEALSILYKSEISTFGASRTDAEVHAHCNFYHFDAEYIPENFIYHINAILPHTIAIREVLKATDSQNANARFDATSRLYHYKIHFRKDPFNYKRSYYYPYKLQFEQLLKTADIILKHKDFETFSKRKTSVNNFNCDILESKWIISEHSMYYVVRANRFLRGMVRGLVGTQLNCARGKFTIDEFEQKILEKNCTHADFSVPGYGLYLMQITYPEDFFDSSIE